MNIIKGKNIQNWCNFKGKPNAGVNMFTFSAPKALFAPHIYALTITQIEVRCTLYSAQGMKFSCKAPGVGVTCGQPKGVKLCIFCQLLYTSVKICILSICLYQNLAAVALLLRFPYCLEVVIDRVEDVRKNNSQVHDGQNDDQSCDCRNCSSNDVLVFSCQLRLSDANRSVASRTPVREFLEAFQTKCQHPHTDGVEEGAQQTPDPSKLYQKENILLHLYCKQAGFPALPGGGYH